MADGAFTNEGIEIGLPEYLGDQPHLSVDVERLAVGCSDARAFLASVL